MTRPVAPEVAFCCVCDRLSHTCSLKPHVYRLPVLWVGSPTPSPWAAFQPRGASGELASLSLPASRGCSEILGRWPPSSIFRNSTDGSSSSPSHRFDPLSHFFSDSPLLPASSALKGPGNYIGPVQIIQGGPLILRCNC